MKRMTQRTAALRIYSAVALASTLLIVSACGAGSDSHAQESRKRNTAFTQVQAPTDDRVLNSIQVIAPYGELKADGGIAIDTSMSKDKWNPCAKIGMGEFSPGVAYMAVIHYRVDWLGDDAYFLFNVRPISATNHLSDLVIEYAKEAPGQSSTREMRFTIPEGKKDYAVWIHTRNQVRGKITAVEICARIGDRIIPVRDGGAPVAMPAQAVGSKEFVIDQPRLTGAPVMSVADFGATPGLDDNVGPFNRAIQHCVKVGAGKLVVPRGEYRFTSDIPLLFEGLKDFTFDGGGSKFVYLKKDCEMVRVTSCERVVFKDLSLDWDWDKDPLASVVRVKAATGKLLDLEFVDHRRFPRRDVRIADLETLDPSTMSVGIAGGEVAHFEFYKGKSIRNRFTEPVCQPLPGAEHTGWVSVQQVTAARSAGRR